MRNLRAAVGFLTRVPLPLPAGDPPALRSTVPWFPVVGALIGAAVGGVTVGLGHLVPTFVAAAAAVMFGVTMTGAFHEDGLADVSDAFAGGWNRDERLRILDDPLHGSYGVAAMCGSIIIRVACVASLGWTPAAAFASIVAAHVLGRSAAVAVMAVVPNASAEGLGAEATRSLDPRRAWIGATGGVAIAAIAAGWWIGPFVAAAVVGAAAVVWLAKRKIGGINGDVLGTIEQVVECLVLVTASGLATHTSLWW